MDNSAEELHQDEASVKKESVNKRKRRYSSIDSDESLRKRTATTSPILNSAAEHENISKNDIEKSVPLETADFIEESNQNEFLLEELCDEVLYEIVKFLDTWSLMALMNVSKRFQKFVLDKRLWANIDLSKEPLPLGILEDMLERSYDKTKTIKLRGPSPSQHIEGEIKHFNQTIHNSLTTRCTKLVTLELYCITLDFNQTTFKDFPQTLKRLVFHNCNVRLNSTKLLFTGIDTVLINLEELAIENNSWFDPYYIMPLSKLPNLRYLSLKGCWQMQEFIPYGSIAARHGFKQLEILDLRDTPLNDSDLQCFNAIETLKEIYLQCPEEDNNKEMAGCSLTTTQNESANNITKKSMLSCAVNSENENKASTSENCVKSSNKCFENVTVLTLPATSPSVSNSASNRNFCSSNSSKDKETPLLNTTSNFNDNDSSPSSSSVSNSASNRSVLTPNSSTSIFCSSNSSKDEESPSLNTTSNLNDNDSSTSSSSVSDSARTRVVNRNSNTSIFCSSNSSKDNDNDSSTSSSSSSSSPSCSQSSKENGANSDNNSDRSSTSSLNYSLSPNILPLVGSNAPPRSRFLPRPDHIFYLNVRNRTSQNPIQFNVRDYNNVRHVRLHNREQQGQQNQQNQNSPPPVIEQMMRHNLFWDIVNPLGRVVGVGAPEENSAEYHLNLFSLSSPIRQQARGSISDRGVCCFGRTRQPVQHGVIWIRFNNRPSENRFERFSVRDYKLVTDVSLQHLVQCSPHLVFLDVSGTSVTLEGLQRFKELKPECKVIAEHLAGISTSV